ncbi:hypothetical protein KXQ82_06400 [Mucilaginibacter sp. HMF5004]|uniref:hypothetical protein n=1 Tax=Mucilaginibacter rivuli TaxID=2857527 RepID=UPI001C5D665F|nr:hypothetical protein [Mucilaginibacter rivuli]MBW4889337.1 hypothetical protein [Mucilaginibacter rivuli]
MTKPGAIDNISRRLKLPGFIVLCFFIATFYSNAQVLKINTINSSLSKDDRAYYGKMAAFEAKFFNTVFGTTKNDSCLVTVEFYGKLKEYNSLPSRVSNSTFIDGFYSPFYNKVYTYKSDRYMSVLIHETSHCILENNYHNSPQWLNEGVATLFSNLVLQNGDVYYTKNLGNINLVKDMIYDGTFNLKSFFNYNPRDFMDVTKRPYVYAVSYDIVYFLVNFDIDYLQRTLVLMQQGVSTMDAFGRVFGGFDKFEKRFKDFYKPEVGYRAHLFKYDQN